MKLEDDSNVMVVINEQHSVLPEQQKLIDKWDMCEYTKIPADGLDKFEQQKLAQRLSLCEHVLFISPVPYLMSLTCVTARGHVWIMHNDKREKKELPGGKVISIVAKEGWEALQVK